MSIARNAITTERTPSPNAESAWLAYHTLSPEAPMRLFCLPHAGGGALLFRHWGPAFAPLAEICPVQLPGREGRIGEPAFTSLPPLVARLATVLAPYLDRPFAILGHSMGGLIGFELARELRRRGLPAPVQLFIASYCGPQLLRREHRASTVRQEAARHLDGAAAVPVAMREELIALFGPTLEADTRLCEDYEYIAEEPLDCPIAVFRGNTDYVRDDHLAGWRADTRGAFQMQTFLGDHFFLRDTPRGVIQAIRRVLTGHAAHASHTSGASRPSGAAP